MTGESRALFTIYVRSVQAWLHREAYLMCKDWHDAEDLAQLTLCQIYRRWNQLEDHQQLNAYTRQTLRHTYLSERRRLRWVRETCRPEPPDLAYICAYNNVDDRLTMALALAELAPRQRAVVTLRFYDDLSIEQTATVLGCSTGTVRSQTHLALKRLRTVLEKWKPTATPPGAGPGQQRPAEER